MKLSLIIIAFLGLSGYALADHMLDHSTDHAADHRTDHIVGPGIAPIDKPDKPEGTYKVYLCPWSEKSECYKACFREKSFDSFDTAYKALMVHPCAGALCFCQGKELNCPPSYMTHVVGKTEKIYDFESTKKSETDNSVLPAPSVKYVYTCKSNKRGEGKRPTMD